MTLNDLSFAIQEGKVVGLIGPNGSGKSTAFNVIIGMFKPNAATQQTGILLKPPPGFQPPSQLTWRHLNPPARERDAKERSRWG